MAGGTLKQIMSATRQNYNSDKVDIGRRDFRERERVDKRSRWDLKDTDCALKWVF